MNEWIAELEELRARDLGGENLSNSEYARWDYLAELIREGYAEEAKRYDTP